jgi:hypothetical protein
MRKKCVNTLLPSNLMLLKRYLRRLKLTVLSANCYICILLTNFFGPLVGGDDSLNFQLHSITQQI